MLALKDALLLTMGYFESRIEYFYIRVSLSVESCQPKGIRKPMVAMELEADTTPIVRLPKFYISVACRVNGREHRFS